VTLPRHVTDGPVLSACRPRIDVSATIGSRSAPLCKDVGVGDLTDIFKAYDVRGLVPSQLDEHVSHRMGAAFADELAAGSDGDGAVVIGHDMRPSSPALAGAFADGVRDRGTDVVMIGLASTDMLYFASGRLGLSGAMFTASHNPARYNGVKLCRPGAVALSAQTGLNAIRRRMLETAPVRPADRRGSSADRDLLSDYAGYLNALVPVAGRRLRVVVDAGNAMAGLTAPAVLGPLDLELMPLYFELDGTFPNHEPNPLQPANLVDLQAAVVRVEADMGLAFDGDADRCFVVDGPDRADRRALPRPGAGRARDPQPDHEQGGCGNHRGPRWYPGKDAGRPLADQGHHGEHQRDLRR
jgi:phosphomannomutase